MASSMSVSLSRLSTVADTLSERLAATVVLFIAGPARVCDPFAPLSTGPSPDPFVGLAPLLPVNADARATACGVAPLAEAGGTALTAGAGVAGTTATGAAAYLGRTVALRC